MFTQPPERTNRVGTVMPDLTPLWLTLHLALVTTLSLLLLGTPIAWWLARTRSRLKVL